MLKKSTIVLEYLMRMRKCPLDLWPNCTHVWANDHVTFDHTSPQDVEAKVREATRCNDWKQYFSRLSRGATVRCCSTEKNKVPAPATSSQWHIRIRYDRSYMIVVVTVCNVGTFMTDNHGTAETILLIQLSQHIPREFKCLRIELSSVSWQLCSRKNIQILKWKPF